MSILEIPVNPDYESMIKCVLREKEPERVHFSELFLDDEIIEASGEKFGLLSGLDRSDPLYVTKRDVKVYSFLGYDMARIHVPGVEFDLTYLKAADTTDIDSQIRNQRDWVNEHSGPIQSWDDFTNFPWPEIQNADLSALEWCEKNLPEGMKVYDLTTHIFENLSWSLGFETMCYKLYDEPDLVQAVADRVGDFYLEFTKLLCDFHCVGVIWGSDDMGFKTQPLMSPDKLRELILPWHKKAARIAHENDKPYFLHACGHIEDIMDDLIDDVKIDAKHSFEDAIMPVTEVCEKYGDRAGILGGIDMDILCRSDEETIRKKVRETLDACFPGGGYCLGSGNTIANYMPLENYLAMMDEGRRYCRD